MEFPPCVSVPNPLRVVVIVNPSAVFGAGDWYRTQRSLVAHVARGAPIPILPGGVNAVLNAAALTYVAAAAGAVLQLLYWVSLLSGRRD